MLLTADHREFIAKSTDMVRKVGEEAQTVLKNKFDIYCESALFA